MSVTEVKTGNRAGETRNNIFIKKLLISTVCLMMAVCVLSAGQPVYGAVTGNKNTNIKTKTEAKQDKEKEPKADNKSNVNKKAQTDKKDVIPAQNSINTPLMQKKGIYHVAQDGTGDFTNLSTAVVSVPSGSTLIIHEGIYNEALNIIGKVVNMRGVSRDMCVIQYDTANYAMVPLNIAGGTYENLTIRGYHQSEDLAAFQGYAIHIDNDALAGQAVNFNNCNIISENAFCVGIGLRKNAKIAFRGCNFTAKKQGAVLFHDSQNPALAGRSSLSFENCIINNQASGLVITQCLSPASMTELTFKNNSVTGVGDGACLAYGSYAGDGNGWMGAHNVMLTKQSAGNNIMSFNYADMEQYRAMLTEQAQLNAAKSVVDASGKPDMKRIAETGISPSGKYYALKNEEGVEVNVPAELVDLPHEYTY